MATAFQAQIRALGGDQELDSSPLDAANRSFMDLKQAITGEDGKAIVLKVERGGDHIEAKYEAAMNETDLSSATSAAISDGQAGAACPSSTVPRLRLEWRHQLSPKVARSGNEAA